jgi:hypothetical protein
MQLTLTGGLPGIKPWTLRDRRAGFAGRSLGLRRGSLGRVSSRSRAALQALWARRCATGVNVYRGHGRLPAASWLQSRPNAACEASCVPIVAPPASPSSVRGPQAAPTAPPSDIEKQSSAESVDVAAKEAATSASEPLKAEEAAESPVTPPASVAVPMPTYYNIKALQWMDRYFEISERGSTVWREVRRGVRVRHCGSEHGPRPRACIRWPAGIRWPV